MGLAFGEDAIGGVRVGGSVIRRAYVGGDLVYDPDLPAVAKNSQPWPGGTMIGDGGNEWLQDGASFSPAETGATYDVEVADIGTDISRYDGVTGLESAASYTVERVQGIRRADAADDTVYVAASWGQTVTLVAIVSGITSKGLATLVSLESSSHSPGVYINFNSTSVKAVIRTTGPVELTHEVAVDITTGGPWLIKAVWDDGDASLYVRELDGSSSATNTDTYDSTSQSGSGALELFRRHGGNGSYSAASLEAAAIGAAIDDRTADGWAGDLVADGVTGHASIIEYLVSDGTVEEGDTVTAGNVGTNGGTPVVRSGTAVCTHGGLNVAI